MSNSNLGWLFYKGYFRDLKWSGFLNGEFRELEDTINSKIDKILNESVNLPNEESLLFGNSHITVTTTYPGLLIGSGYMHELGKLDGELSLGLDFDYTTGLPIIRGSSIKGVLRSAFQEIDYIQEIFKELFNKKFSKEEIKKIEIEIFGQESESEEISKGQDTFFDAFPYNPYHNKEIRLLDDDYITPHSEDNFKNPTPIRFLKVSSGVSFLLNFNLKDTSLSKEEKIKLFIRILEDLGLGAKTNVGYGHFNDNIKEYITKKDREKEIKKEIEKEFDKITEQEELDRFISKYGTKNIGQDKIDIKRKEIENKLECEKIEKAFNNLNKSKKEYIKSFIESKKDIDLECAKKLIEEAKKLLQPQPDRESQSNEFNLENINSFGSLIRYLDKFKNRGLTETQKDILKRHILENIKIKKNFKRKKLISSILNNLLGENEVNRIANKLGLK